MKDIKLEDYIEHTLLKQDATKEDLIKLFDEAKKYNFHSVCVNPVNVKLAQECLKLTDVRVCCVIGFPLGATPTEVKVYEAAIALRDGAEELDMVMNLGAFKDKDYAEVKKDISTVKSISTVPLKVIIETDLLTQEEIKTATQLVVESGADFVKTSTGFLKNGVGAKVEDIKIMAEIAHANDVMVKASGGIKTKEQALALIEAGADRLGTSSGVAIVS